jgi:hypothetical protein
MGLFFVLLWLNMFVHGTSGSSDTCFAVGIDVGTSNLRTSVFDVAAKSMVSF